MKKMIAFIVAFLWCVGLSWVSHEVYVDMLVTTNFTTAWAMSAFMGLMNLVTTFLLYFFIAFSKDF